MALEILRVHLFILLPVLVVLSWGKAFSNTVRCNICSQPISKAICLQFYDDTTDFPDAKQKCENINSARTLMSENEYAENKECVNEYLRDLNHSNTSIWLDWSTTGKNAIYHAKIFDTSGVRRGDKDNVRHSRICIEQVAPESSMTTSGSSEVHTNNSIVNNRSTVESSTPGNGKMTTSTKDSRVPLINKSTPPGTDNSKTREDNEDSSLAVALPVALVTAAVVLTLCCIVCVACGAILYRKRDKIIRCIARMNTLDRRAADAVESVELRSTLDMYANIKANRPISEKCQPKPRFLNNQRVSIENDDEIYSSANTYSNVDLLKKLSDESSMSCRQHNTTNRASSLPPSYALCVARSDGQTQKVSGRYISDGLVYTTLAHTAHGRRPRPVKAKSDEHVEYVTLDFEKTGKMHKNKKKSVNHSRSMEG